MNFKDVWIVKLRSDSVFFTEGIIGGVNPTGMLGEVIEANNGNDYLSLRVTVRWENGCENCYDEHDLEFLECK